jgi:hypothetical protein
MDQLAQTMDQNAAVSTKSLKGLSESSFRLALAYKEKYKSKSTKQRDLLSAYLDVSIKLETPYADRRGQWWRDR